MTKINQSLFELREHKEKVSRYMGWKQTRASTGQVMNHCTVAISSQGPSRDVWHVLETWVERQLIKAILKINNYNLSMLNKMPIHWLGHAK